MNWDKYFIAFLAAFAVGLITWVISVIKKDVSIVDSVWSLMFVAGGAVFFFDQDMTVRSQIIFGLLVVWAARLSIHITLRSWGEEEDHRYQSIRSKYQPHFAIKSLFIIFLFQVVLASIVLMPVAYALSTNAAWSDFDYVAAALVLFGIAYESMADYQLQAYKSTSENKSGVLNTGLWKYSRHPNYFGESIVWWGLFIFAAVQGDYISIISPLLMTFLLLKFSGVGLMEEDITDRRPAYQQYILSTNAFIPGPKKTTSQEI